MWTQSMIPEVIILNFSISKIFNDRNDRTTKNLSYFRLISLGIPSFTFDQQTKNCILI